MTWVWPSDGSSVVGSKYSLAFWLATYLVDDVGVARGLAPVMVSLLHAANLAGRLLASRLARHLTTERARASAIVVGLTGLPILLRATNVTVAAIGLALAGREIGATFPLTSSLHVVASARVRCDRSAEQTPRAPLTIRRLPV